MLFVDWQVFLYSAWLFVNRLDSGTYISFLRSSGIEYPVGLEPIGMVYRTFGLRTPGFSVSQLSRTCLRCSADKPCESVLISTSTGTFGRIAPSVPLCKQENPRLACTASEDGKRDKVGDGPQVSLLLLIGDLESGPALCVRIGRRFHQDWVALIHQRLESLQT